MGIEEMVEIEKQADEFMKKSAEQREKLLYIAVLRSDRRIEKIEQNGCSRADEVHGVGIGRWTPAMVGTAVTTGIIAILEWLRNLKG